MCGIFGYLSNRQSISEVQVQQAIDAIQHRGPDGDGIWKSDAQELWLAHKRLAIIDLDIRSAQPMHDRAHDLVIVFNGEIYNYIELRNQLLAAGHDFKTESDTEVILKGYVQWGKEVLNRLKGMFAFALFDKRTNQLLLARDRMGEKPLFIFNNGHTIAFASELKALLALPAMPRQVKKEALEHILAYGYASRSQCILKEYAKLPPAHAMVIDTVSLQHKIYCYWQAPLQQPTPGNTNADELAAELKQVLAAAVKRQLVADVPVGILLSGGVDSSLLTALAASVSDNVNTFNVSFPGSPEDESEHAEGIAAYFGTRHTTIPAEAASVEWLPALAMQYDEPMTDQSIIPTYMLCRVVKRHCTVALGGDGADELFGGYHRYQRMINLAQQAKPVPLVLRKTASSIASSLLPIGFRGRHSLMEFATDFTLHLPVEATLFDLNWRNQLLPGEHFAGAAELLAKAETISALNIAERAMRTDLVRYMPEDILVKSDRAAMLASLEVRAPFLDVDVVDFALQRIPTSLKVDAGSRKIILKKLASQMLPADYDAGRKQGFVPPLDKWLQNPAWQQFFKDTLLTGNANWFDKAAVEKLLAGQQKGQFNKRRIFALLMIEMWRKAYHITLE